MLYGVIPVTRRLVGAVGAVRSLPAPAGAATNAVSTMASAIAQPPIARARRPVIAVPPVPADASHRAGTPAARRRMWAPPGAGGPPGAGSSPRSGAHI